MAFLKYEYTMKINYSEPVDKCYFTIKFIPADDFRQKNISYEIELIPETSYSEGKDSFGNIQIIGCENRVHSKFEYKIKGMAETQASCISGGVNQSTIGMYKYPYGKCIPGQNLQAYAEELKEEIEDSSSTFDKCVQIMKLLYEKMTYETGSTDVDTTAEEAFSSGKGVCQDFSHIFICLLRLLKIPARYVCGLIVGEGQSHAWVEAECDGKFVGFDPTFNREITDEYIKFGVGRDAGDCSINKGVMWGGGFQNQDIKVSVEKYI